MTFRGLFVGIDRYQSKAINWLSCACRDAVALHALFTDTLGGETRLLIDTEATYSTIQEQFKQLAACDEDDIVVVAFSGHGTETHQLVTYDTDVSDLHNTAILLDTLSEYFFRIPARRLICFLDCCFSGGMGAKALQVETIARNLDSTELLLNQLSGEGRLILTASKATERAYENTRLGHGLLTYYLLEALQGVEEVQRSGKIDVYQLISYVTRRVTDAAMQLSKPQHPTLRGTLDGELTWPVLKAGSLYQAAFPERSRPKVTTDIQSLVHYRFPPELLQVWASAIPSLNQLQVDAINDFNLLEDENLVATAPTSSGKTMLGELVALKGALEHKRTVFLLPLKALVNDKFKHFMKTYSSFGIQTVVATAETDDITPFLKGQYDVCLLTYEKFAAVVLTNPHVLAQIATVVVDEVQMLADASRGANLEFILTLLRMRRQEETIPQLILLSGVIGDTNGLEHWLCARLLRRSERPIPLDEGILLADCRFRYLDALSGEEKFTEPLIQRRGKSSSSQDWVIPLAQRLVKENKQIIVFRETKAEAQACARYLASELELLPAQAVLDSLPKGDRSKATEDLCQCLLGGIAFHTSNLAPEERRVVEKHFCLPNTSLRIIVATTTLAMGVNTPASAVIIVGLEHPPDKKLYTVSEYKNLVGRAGRLGQSERGTSYLLAPNSLQAHHFWNRYIKGTPENLQSRFLNSATDLRSLIVRVLVAVPRAVRQGVNSDDILNFLEASFGAFQQARLSEDWKWNRNHFRNALDDLQKHNLVEIDLSSHCKLTPLGQLAGEAGVEVSSILRLVECLAPLKPDELNDPTLVAAAQITVEMDEVLFPINKKSTQKEPKVWTNELRSQSVPNILLTKLHEFTHNSHQGTLRAKKAVACLLYVTQQPMAEIEKLLTQFGGAPNGAAGAIRAVASRTCDLLPAVIRVAEILHPDLDLEQRQIRLLTRLETGLPASAVELATQIGSRLTRGDYLRLLAAKLCSADAVEASTDETLLPYLDNDPEKLSIVRNAVRVLRQQQLALVAPQPLLAPYES